MRTRAMPEKPPGRRAKKKGDKSGLSANARRIIERTRAARAALDALAKSGG